MDPSTSRSARTGSRLQAKACILLLTLAVLPFCVPPYYVLWLNTLAVNVLVAVGLNLLVGVSGQLSLGHAGFVAIGAYSCVLAMTKLGLPAPLALLLATSLAGAIGLLLGLPTVRLKGPYLAVATLAFGACVVQTLGRWSLFGGHMGLNAPKFQLLGIELNGDRALYGLIVPVTVLMVAMGHNLTQSRLGRALVALRNNEQAASAFGIDVARTKVLAFALSAAYAGLAGGLWAFVLGYLHPDMFDFFLSVLFLIMIVAGGLGHTSGAVLGAMLVTALHLVLRNPAEIPGLGPLLVALSRGYLNTEGLAHLRYLIFGVLLIALVRCEPRGIWGLAQRLRPSPRPGEV